MRDAGSTDSGEAVERPKVVFLVDDDHEFREITSELLKRRGYEMILAASAEEASEVIESYEGEIDVLLMDINLPDGWGGDGRVSFVSDTPEYGCSLHDRIYQR